MELRRARPDDSSGIERIECACFSDPFNKRDIFSYICSEDGMCFVAVEGGEVIGYLIGRIIPPEGEIYRVAVSENHRRRGIGYRLLSFSLKSERGRGLESTFLEVRSKNIAARSLYSAYGFKQISTRKSYYKNPDDDAIVMLYP